MTDEEIERKDGGKTHKCHTCQVRVPRSKAIPAGDHGGRAAYNCHWCWDAFNEALGLRRPHGTAVRIK